MSSCGLRRRQRVANGRQRHYSRGWSGAQGRAHHRRRLSRRRREWAILSLCGVIGSPPCVRPHRDCHVAPLLIMTAIIPSPLMGEGWGEGENPRQMSLRGAPAHPELVEGRGNPVGAATAVRRRVFSPIEIARRCAPRNDRIGLMRTHLVIASVAWQSCRHSNVGSPTCVQHDRLKWVRVRTGCPTGEGFRLLQWRH